MNISDRPIAMTDLKTTGTVFGEHEILEIGLVLFDPKTFAILDTLNVKVKPEHIERADPQGLIVNGYNEKEWQNALPLTEAIKLYAEKTRGAIFAGFNATFDWGFMNEAFRTTKVKYEMDYHRLDLLSIAWERGLKKETSWQLKKACEVFGVPPEPAVHTALNGAMTAYNLFKKLQLDK